MARKKRVLAWFLVFSVLVMLCALLFSAIAARAVSILVAEMVSENNLGDSKNPVVSAGDNDLNTLHVAWEDDTDGDKKIFYREKNGDQWSYLHQTQRGFEGGILTVSPDSITSSANPDMATGSDNVTHIVWSALTRPPKLEADQNTTFFLNFDDETLTASYAKGNPEPVSFGDHSFSAKSIYNKSLYLEGDGVGYNATNNLNPVQGTIELWYNPVTGKMGGPYASFNLFGCYEYGTFDKFELSYLTNNLPGIYLRLMVDDNKNNSMFLPKYEVLRANIWHHIALVYDFSNSSISQFSIYFDGVLEKQHVAGFNKTWNTMNMTCEIGRDGFYSWIDELRISDRKRNATEIKADAGKYDIYYRKRNSTDFMETYIVTSNDTNISLYPKIDVDRRNTAHIVWSSYHNNSLINVRYVERNGTAFSVPEQVNLPAGQETFFPDIAVDSSNFSHVVWQDNNASDFSQIYYRMKNRTDWSAISYVSNKTYMMWGVNESESYTRYIFQTPSIAIDSSNAAHVAWADTTSYPEEGLDFYLSFDNGDANVTYANGSRLSNNIGSAVIASGYDGIATYRSINITGEQMLNYSGSGNINPNQGTIEMWVRADWDQYSYAPGTYHALFYAGSSNHTKSGIDTMISLYTSYNSSLGGVLLEFHIQNLSQGVLGDNFVSTNTRWGPGSWNHVAATWNLSQGSSGMHLYVDAVLLDDTIYPNTTTPIILGNPLPEIQIGNLQVDTGLDFNNLSSPWNGSIDDVMIHDRALTREEILGDATKDMDILYRSKNASGWSGIRLLSPYSNYMALLPSLSAKGNKVYYAAAVASNPYAFKFTSNQYGANFKIYEGLINTTAQRMNQIVNDEFEKSGYAPSINAKRGDIDVAFESQPPITGTYLDIYYRELSNTTLPNANITYPAGNEIFQSDFDVNGTASDPDSAISSVSYYYTQDRGVTGGFICTSSSVPYSCTADVTYISEEDYTIKAIVTSNDGGKNWSKMAKNFYVDSSPFIKAYTYNDSGNGIITPQIFSKGYKTINITTERPRLDNSSTLSNLITDEIMYGTNQTSKELISSPDDQRLAIDLPLDCNAYDYINSLLLVMPINESPSSIISLRLFWEGFNDYTTSGYTTNLSIWNFSSNEWLLLDSKSFSETSDGVLSHTLTSGISDFVATDYGANPGFNFTAFLIEGEDHHDYSCRYSWHPGGPIFICPAYYSWSGDNYSFEVEGILGLFNDYMETPTYDRLNHLMPEDGKLKVKIAEIVDETTYMDQVSLIAIDHPKGTEALFDVTGKPRLIKNVQGVMCEDRFGNDCSQLVEKEDERPENALSSLEGGLVASRSLYDPAFRNGPEGEYWVSDLSAIDDSSSSGDSTRDYLELTLPEPEAEDSSNDVVKLVISASDTGLLGLTEMNLMAVVGNDTMATFYNLMDNTYFGRLVGDRVFSIVPMHIKVLDDDNEWVDYPELFRNAIAGSYRKIIIPLNRSLVRGNKIRLDMWTYSYMIDFIGVDYSDDDGAAVTEIPSGLPELEYDDGVRHMMSYGQSVELEFDEPQKKQDGTDSSDDNSERSYFLKTTGYYHPGENDNNRYKENVSGAIDALSEIKNIRNGLEYLKMISGQSYSERYFLDQYLGLLDNEASAPADSAADYGSGEAAKQKEHHTLYTDYAKVVVNTCVEPIDDLEIRYNTTFCAGITKSLSDDNYDGVIRIYGDGVSLDCNGDSIDGGGSNNINGHGYGEQGKGIGIDAEWTTNVDIKNCNVSGYEVGILANYSTNVKIHDNHATRNYINIKMQGTNNSLITDNLMEDSNSAGIFLNGGSTSNIAANNTILNSFMAGIVLNMTSNDTIEDNIVNNTLGDPNPLWSSGGRIVGISLSSESYYNTIKNNIIDSTYTGMGMLDLETFTKSITPAPVGMYNNFSSNIMKNVYFGIGMIKPYDADYFNYFENNLINDNHIDYYINLKGNSSNYVQLNGLNLTGSNTTLYLGQLTLVNSSYVNITGSNFSGNFFGLLLVNCSNITISDNLAWNNDDSFILPFFVFFGSPAGAAFSIINSKDITIYRNNADSNNMGYSSLNSMNINFIDNTARSSKQFGFWMDGANNSLLINNTAELSNRSGFMLENIMNTKMINNTARQGQGAFNQYGMESHTGFGLKMSHSFNNTVENNTFIDSIYGLGLFSSNDSFSSIENNTIMNNTYGVAAWNCPNGSIIDLAGNIIENNSIGVLFENCSYSTAKNINTRNNSDKGIVIKNTNYFMLANSSSNENDVGLFLDSSSSNVIARFTAMNNTANDVYFYYTGNNNIDDSIITRDIGGTPIRCYFSFNDVLLNVTLDPATVTFGDPASYILRKWYLTYYVADNESTPVSDANVSLNDSLGNRYFALTDRNAFVSMNMTEYRETSSGRTYFSDYLWNISKPGYSSNSSSVNMSQNRHFNVTLNILGGIPDTEAPTPPIVFDGYYYADEDWTNNATTLFASWINSTDRHLIFYEYRIFENGVCLPGYCASFYMGQDTRTMTTGLSLIEGSNYTFSVRARDTNYYYAPYSSSDGIIVDLTPPTVTVNSTTHPNSSQPYSNPNVTFVFYGNDSLSGIGGYSFMLDEDSGTGPDTIEETREKITLHEGVNTGYSTTLKENGTGQAFAVFRKINRSISSGDNLAISVPLLEEGSETIDNMQAIAYIIPGSATPNSYNMEPQKISDVAVLSQDILYNLPSNAQSYSFNVVAVSDADTFYVVVAGSLTDNGSVHNLSIAGTDYPSLIDNSTKKYLCGSVDGCTETTNTADYAIKITKKDTSAVWNETYYNLANGVHWFHVRARDVAGNWGNPAHFRVMVDAINGTPVITRLKPRGYIATTSPTLVIGTNEYTTCHYNTTNLSYAEMTSYDGMYHETKLTGLSEGTYRYGFNCTDLAGNSAYNETAFVVDLNAAPDIVSISPMGNYTAGKPVLAYVNVTKDYSGVYYGLGELADYFSVNVSNASGYFQVASTVADLGDGLYTVLFTAPMVEGDYTLRVSVKGVSDTEPFAVRSYTLRIQYSDSGIGGMTKTDNLVFGSAGKAYKIGLASDSPSASTAGSSAGSLIISAPAVNDNLFIFITNALSSTSKVVDFLTSGSFTDLKNPSFGYPLDQDEHVLSAMLEYNDISIVGSQKVQNGRYTLVIKNEGIDPATGKTRVRISLV